MPRRLACIWTFLSLFVALVTNGNAAEVPICSIVANPKSFDHQSVSLQGTIGSLRETTSRRGNDYTTFVFTWGHPVLTNGGHVHVDGVFETEHHQGPYTFYNEVEATKVTPLCWHVRAFK